jgi:adenosylhomocysteinase
MAKKERIARENVQEFTLSNGRYIFLVAEGRLVNLGAAEGHPAMVMDMSFANQALSAEWMAKHYRSLDRKVYKVPQDIDREIARLKLKSMGVGIDRLTKEQEKYLAGWEVGT